MRMKRRKKMVRSCLTNALDNSFFAEDRLVSSAMVEELTKVVADEAMENAWEKLARTFKMSDEAIKRLKKRGVVRIIQIYLMN